MMEEIIPGFWRRAPLERPVVEQNLWILSADAAFKIGHRHEVFAAEPPNCFTVLRAKFDQWFAQQAVEAGVFLVPETLIEELLVANGRVVGVRAGREEGEVYADVVVLAEGVNAQLAQQAGLREEIAPQNVAVAVKEVLALPRKEIEARFNLTDNQGATIELIGTATAGLVGTGFLYTNRDSLSVGVGVLAADLVEAGLTPYDLLEQVKAHPSVRPLIEGAEPREYLAHLIPEGGYREVPSLVHEGLLIVGDAAMLVNSLHREGANLALTSGRLAAETILEAKKRGDFSASALAPYRQRLEDSFVLADLKKYQEAPRFLATHPHLFQLYPRLLNEVAREWLTVDGVPKREKQRAIWRRVTQARPLRRIIGDLWAAWRALR